MGMETTDWIKDLLVEPYPDRNLTKRLLRVLTDPESIEIRFCEMIDPGKYIDKCISIVCETNNDYCFVADLYGLFPNIKILKKIEGERASLVRNKLKEITNLSGDAALNAFNNLLHEIMVSNKT